MYTDENVSNDSLPKMRYDHELDKYEMNNDADKDKRFNEIENDLQQAKQRCN